MNTPKMADSGQGVNPPAKGAYKPEKGGKVIDLGERRKSQVYAWLDAHAVDAKGNRKPPSLDSLYAAMLCSGDHGLWACQSGAGTGSVVHRWNEVYWQPLHTEEGAGEASAWLEDHARHSATDDKALKCWRYAATRLRKTCALPPADPKRALVPCADGYVEIHNDRFEVLAPDPALGMVHAVKVKCGGVAGQPYTPRELPEGSVFRRFIERALPDPKVRAVVQEQCGMTLLPGNYSQAAWWFGAAGSGKSTLAELVEAMHRQAVRIGLETLGDRFSLEPLIGASLILVDEVECERWAEGRFKTIVSGNGIGIDRKNEKALASYHSRAKWIITSNGAPFVRDKSDGVWRRLTVVHWTCPVPDTEKVGDLQHRILEHEGALVLDWMLQGAQRIVARGRAMADHELPDPVRRAKQGARHNSDSVRAWAFNERVQAAPGQFMALADVYQRFASWCQAQGLTPTETLTSRQFWRGMADAGLVNTNAKSNRRIGGKQVECYELEILGQETQGPPVWEPDTMDDALATTPPSPVGSH